MRKAKPDVTQLDCRIESMWPDITITRMVPLLITLSLLLLPLKAVAAKISISVGMNRDEAVALVKKCNATDISPSLQIIGPKGEWPVTGTYWSFPDYDAVLAL